MNTISTFPVEELAAAKAYLKQHGLVIIESVLDQVGLARVRDAVKRGVESDRKADIQLQGFAFDPDDRNIRLFDLVSKDRTFRDLVEHPIAVDLASFWLGDNFLLSNFSGNITAPGSGAMNMHADAGYMPVPWPPYPIALNIAWDIDDFRADNGATRYVPGSYHMQHGPDYAGSDAIPIVRETRPIQCKADSVFVMDGRVWHQTGPNTSKDQTRTGLFAYYTRSFIRPQFNWFATVPDEVLQESSPRLREMLGFGSNDSAKSADYPQLRKLKFH